MEGRQLHVSLVVMKLTSHITGLLLNLYSHRRHDSVESLVAGLIRASTPSLEPIQALSKWLQESLSSGLPQPEPETDFVSR